MRVIGYLRVSTDLQEHGIAAQRTALASEAERRGWDVTWLEDSGRSGRTLDRPAVREALDLLSKGEAQALAVSKLDRLTRSVYDFSGLLAIAHKQGWGLVTLDLGVDTTTPAGKLVANIMAAVAEWERDMIALRTREGLAAARTKGVRIGRPPRLDARVVERIHTERAQGRPYRAIADDLNAERVPTPGDGRCWHANSVRVIAGRTA
jgi:DNA invertase Pin-like site-specific DNA recombinase